MFVDARHQICASKIHGLIDTIPHANNHISHGWSAIKLTTNGLVIPEKCEKADSPSTSESNSEEIDCMRFQHYFFASQHF